MADNPFRVLVESAAKSGQRDSWRWATVTSVGADGVSDVRIQFDAQSSPLAIPVDTLVPVGVGYRVRVLSYAGTVCVIGVLRGSDSLMPTGAVLPFAGVTPPEGWLLCDGSLVSRVTYARLFGVIGETYGAGDGSTTFNLPDLRGRTPVGYSASHSYAATLGATGGEATHTLTVAEMPTHRHTVKSGGPLHFTVADGTGTGVSGIKIGDSGWGSNSPANWLDGSMNAANTINTEGGGKAHNNMPPYVVMNHIIHC